VLAAAMLVAVGFSLPREQEPVSLAYEIDLAAADRGEIQVRLTVAGDVADPLALEFPTSVLDGASGGPNFTVASASQTDGYHNGARPIRFEAGSGRVVIHPDGAYPVELRYRIDLRTADVLDGDLTRHLSVVTAGGFRAAGFAVFLVPASGLARDISVAFTGNTRGEVLAPWPIRSSVEDSTVFQPRDLRDLYNSFFAHGGLRLSEATFGDCRFRLASDVDWLFADQDVMRLARRIATAEVDFFGSVPQPAITCLLAENRLRSASGFDIVGVHTGSSILLLMDPDTSYANLKQHGASIIAHEMFHGWLGEAIRQEHPDMVWFTEGATTLYAARLLAKSGVWSPAEADCSLTQRYRRDYHDNELLGETAIAEAAADLLGDGGTVRFAYAGGSLACERLDTWLATKTGRTHPLDDVLRYLYSTRDDGSLTRARLIAAVAAVTGQDCTTWLERFVYGKETLPPSEPMT